MPSPSPAPSAANAQVKPGLEGVVATETKLSMVDGQNGVLVIAGYPVEELAGKMGRERVHRARIALDLLEEYAPNAQMSPLGSKDLGIPEV